MTKDELIEAWKKAAARVSYFEATDDRSVYIKETPERKKAVDELEKLSKQLDQDTIRKLKKEGNYLC